MKGMAERLRQAVHPGCLAGLADGKCAVMIEAAKHIDRIEEDLAHCQHLLWGAG